ncbi:MAG TPA: hypothetical protein VG738_14330 [Chitinophagaceae bacterium]|nr:hypothetical protein [Chitinophagaceae bacterium]
MPIVFFVLTRVLFAACMVFIIGYVFGGFAKKPALTTLARVACILVIVLFIATGAFFFRGGGWHGGFCHGYYNGRSCADTTMHR